MGYRVKINGLDVSCDTAEDVIALSSAAKSAKTPENSRPPKASPTKPKPNVNRTQVMKFLKAVAKSNGTAIGGKDLMEAVGVEQGAALGGVLSTANRLVAELGIPFEDVAFRVRVDGDRKWQSGPRIKEAIEGLTAQGEHK